jgi:hypothetical protein
VNQSQLLFEKLNAFREGQLGIDEFKACVNTLSESLSKLIPRGILLKFKHGDVGKIMSAAAGILPSCAKCDQIFEQGEFANRSEHTRCSVSVDKALKNGVLVKITKPDWYRPIPRQLGVDVYYKCSSCNAIWNLVEPERHCNGLWDRIA